jgi:hypothetical protein
MEPEIRDALAKALVDIAKTLNTLADEIQKDTATSDYGRASTRLSWNDRLLRQSLIIQDIVSEGGKVTKDRWYEIAAKYGYQGRGLAGFFREGKAGLLEMRGDMVYVTAHGKKRLSENAKRVAAERERVDQIEP